MTPGHRGGPAPSAAGRIRNPGLTLASASSLVLAFAFAAAVGGCVVEQTGGGGFGQRATGNAGIPVPSASDAEVQRNAFLSDAATVVTPAEAFSALPEPSQGRGPARPMVLDAAPPRVGDVYAVDVTVVIEIAIRDASNDGAAVPRFNLADMRAQSVGMFNGRTVGRLRGRLTIQRVDPTGRILRAAFETSEAALARDGALLARVPAARLVELTRTMVDGDGDGTIERDEDGAPILSPLRVRMTGETLGPATVRLFRMCLLGPLESGGWDQRLVTGPGAGRARRTAETWSLPPTSITELLGLPPDAAIRPRGVARVMPDIDALGQGPAFAVVEVRTRAMSVVDERIIEAFGPSLAGLPDAASVHRVRGTWIADGAEPGGPGIAGTRDHVRSSIVAHRFGLVDRQGPLEGQRIERVDASITLMRP